jgi:hypothetical protein
MLKLNGAWLCGLSSVPQGSGLSRLRSSVRKGNILIPKGKKRESLSPSQFVYVRYGKIEKVSNFEIAVAKLKETL